MLSSGSVARYVLPPPVFALRELTSTECNSAGGQLGHLAVLAAKLARMRRALKEQSDSFEKFYSEAAQVGTTSAELEELADVLLGMERQAAAESFEQAEGLKRFVAKHPRTNFARSLKRSAAEALEIIRTWIELHQNLRILFLKLASERRAAAGETASPVFSDPDAMEKYLRRIAEG